MKLVISTATREKLRSKHKNVTEHDILECFANRLGGFLDDTRETHKTNPKTVWFVAETDFGRGLKVAFIEMPSGEIVIKSAYDANYDERTIYFNRFDV
jgi:hypothetical protein